MTVALADTWYMAFRQMRNLARQPWYIAFTLFQPLIYLLLFSQLFERVTQIPGFEGGSYLTFITPGIVVMTALFSAGWRGMSVIQDIDRGVLDRFLVTPGARGSLIFGRLPQLAAVIVLQAAIVVGIGWPRGADYPGGLPGILVLIVCAVLLATAFSGLSIAMSLVARKEESVIGAANFILLPLTFLSSVFMAQNLMPGWMQTAARFNPLNWAAEAGREALSANPDWGGIALRTGGLLILTLAFAWLATRAFRLYQRSL
jgi:ABC-2 type transport system permease protein